MKSHSPQDELYGPLQIPSYCWPIIDTPEFQRLRSILQLSVAHFVYPSATHTRLEHSLGVAHLANIFMEHICISQPELCVSADHCQSVVLAGLCHDVGHGPWSHSFESFARRVDFPSFDHEAMSVSLMNFIIDKYHIAIDCEVVAAAGNFIRGLPHPGYPAWLSRIVANPVDDVDLDKFDYLARDVNRTLSISRFEYLRLIRNCRVVEGQLAWKLSEVHTIERLFFVRNDMHLRVYSHRVVQALNFMVIDMLQLADAALGLSAALDDIEQFTKLDDRIMLLIENGEAGEAAQRIADRILQRKLYQRVGEVRLRPQNHLQVSCETMERDIAEAAQLDAAKIRVGKTTYRFGVRKTEHPLFQIAFWRHGTDAVVKLSEDDLTLFVPMDFFETAINVFVTDADCFARAQDGFERWKQIKGFASK